MKDGFLVVDGDAHMVEPVDLWERYPEKRFADMVPKVVGQLYRQGFIYDSNETLPSRPASYGADMPERFGDAFETGWDLPSRLKHMDDEGIDVQVCFPTNGLAVSRLVADADAQAGLCRGYNTWALEYCSDSGSRVKFIAMCSLADPKDAIREVDRLMPFAEVAGFAIPPFGSLPGRNILWTTPEFDALWAALVASDLPACIHGGGAQTTWFRSLTDAGLLVTSHSLAFPVEAMASIGTLVEGRVLERFPELRVAFYEANAGWLPWYLARLDDHYVGRQHRLSDGGQAEGPLMPSERFARQGFVAGDPDEGQLETAIRFNVDNLVFNSDYPHLDSSFPGSVDKFLDRPFEEEIKRRILWDNSVRLYGSRIEGVHARGIPPR